LAVAVAAKRARTRAARSSSISHGPSRRHGRHTFRKTVATLVDRERGTGDAAAQLGHSSQRITTRHYVETADLAPDVSDVLQRFSE